MTRKCGTCTFGRYVDAQHVECHGNPPQVILMPGPPDLAGNPRMMAQKLRPQMDNSEHGCSLWRSKIAADKEFDVEYHPIPVTRAGGVVIR